jgi:hypothetical protein
MTFSDPDPNMQMIPNPNMQLIPDPTGSGSTTLGTVTPYSYLPLCLFRTVIVNYFFFYVKFHLSAMSLT